MASNIIESNILIAGGMKIAQGIPGFGLTNIIDLNPDFPNSQTLAYNIPNSVLALTSGAAPGVHQATIDVICAGSTAKNTNIFNLTPGNIDINSQNVAGGIDVQNSQYGTGMSVNNITTSLSCAGDGSVVTISNMRYAGQMGMDTLGVHITDGNGNVIDMTSSGIKMLIGGSGGAAGQQLTTDGLGNLSYDTALLERVQELEKKAGIVYKEPEKIVRPIKYKSRLDYEPEFREVKVDGRVLKIRKPYVYKKPTNYTE
jgi:hypothetical protein